MRVLMITDFYWPFLGGVEQHVRSLAHSLSERGHEVTVATLRVDDAPECSLDGPVTVRRIRSATQRLPWLFDQSRPWAPPLADPIARRALSRIIDDVTPDVIHGHDWLARSAQRAAARRRIPVVTSLHYYTQSCAKKDLLRDGRPCDGPGPVRCTVCSARHYGLVKGPAVAATAAIGGRLERRRSAEHIAVSRATASGNGCDPGLGCEVIGNFLPDQLPAPDADDLALADGLPDGPFFLFVGDLRAAKGIDVLLEAYSSLSGPWPLVLIGKIWPASPTSFPTGVTVHDRWPNTAVHEAFRRCGAAVVPSVWSEPFGIVVIEALAAGAAVIASDVGGISEIIEDRRSGLLIPPGRPDELAAVMRTVMRDGALRATLGRGALQRAAAFRAAAVVPQIERIYARAIGT